MVCPNCGEEHVYLIKLPVTLVKETKAGEATYTRDGYKSNGEPDDICFECLEDEADGNM
jgi:hypothetical protein